MINVNVNIKKYNGKTVNQELYKILTDLGIGAVGASFLASLDNNEMIWKLIKSVEEEEEENETKK